jgi:predicted dehydrogenase
VVGAGLTTAVGYHWRYLDTVEEARERLAERPARLVSGYWLDGTPPPAWWGRQALSGGQFVEQTTHVFDLTRLLVGEVEEVFAAAGRSPRAAYPGHDACEASAATLRFRSGAVGSVVSTCLLRWPHRIGLHLFGDGLAIELGEHELVVDAGRGRPVRRAEGDPFAREDRDFVDAVKGGANRIRTPYAEAVETHRLAVAATRSAAERRPILLRGAGRG